MVSPEEILRRYGLGEDEIASLSEEEKAAVVSEALGAGIHASEDPPADGARAAPIEVTCEADLRRAEEVVHPDPSPAQAEAENYRHAHIELPDLGLTGAHSISIETAAGGTRKGPVDAKTGEPAWTATMAATYGRIKGTKGADGEPLDIFVGPEPSSRTVWILDQCDPDTKRYDEHKIFAGFSGPLGALKAYIQSHDGRGYDRIGGMHAFSPAELREWMKGDTTQPVSRVMRNAAEVATRRHHKAIEAALLAVGADPSRVRQEDLTEAARILANDDVTPEQAFQLAVVRSLLQDGHISHDELRCACGDEAEILLDTLRPSGHLAALATPGPTIDWSSSTGTRDVAEGSVADRPEGPEQGRERGGEAEEERPRGQAGGPAERRRTVDEAAGGGRGAANRQQGESTGKDAEAGDEHRAAESTKGAVNDPPPMSILEFLVREGGVKPSRDLRSVGLSNFSRVKMPGGGWKNVVSRDGRLTVDAMVERLLEAGYVAKRGNDPHAQIRSSIAAEASQRG